MPFLWTDVYHIYINYQTNKETEGNNTAKLNFSNRIYWRTLKLASGGVSFWIFPPDDRSVDYFVF